MKVLLLSTRPLGAAEIDRVLLHGLHPTAVDVCPSVNLALGRLETFTPDLIIVNLPQPDASEALRRLREGGIQIPTVVVAPDAAVDAGARATRGQTAVVESDWTGDGRPAPLPDPGDELDLLTHDDRIASEVPAVEARLTDAALAEARDELDQLSRTEGFDVETRWLLYEVASIGHVSTTPDGGILAANDIAAQLLGHFSHDALEAVGAMPTPLLDAAGAFTRRPSRFELCLQHGADGPLHWIVGLALPQGGQPATVTWFLIDVSEQRLQSRRARFLRRMESLTHVLSAATAECTTLVDTGGRALASARERLADDVDVEQAIEALARTQAVLAQLAGFARRRARRPALRDLRALLDQISPVLVHVTGEDVTWTLDTGPAPLHASIDAAEFEQCLTALVTQAREALPLGGQIAMRLSSEMHASADDTTRGARPEIVMTMELQGYGLQPLTIAPAVQTQAMRLGAELTTTVRDHLTTRIVLRMPRVFVTA